MAFSLLMKSFVFPKALMQEHFNENYVESDKFPKATFKGIFAEKISTGKDSVFNITSMGELQIHGVSRPIQAIGTVEVKGGKLYAKSKFFVSPKDYDIVIPRLVEGNIARNIEVGVDAVCDPM
jgi:polyisoprenoid-binding protein YceI